MRPLLLLTVVALLAPSVRAVTESDPVPPLARPATDDGRDAVTAEVRAWRAAGEAPERLTARLEALGPVAAPEVARLVERALEATRDAPGPAPLPAAALVAALGGIGGEASLEPLRSALASAPQETRVAAVGALGRLGLAAGFEPLLAALDDPALEVRRKSSAACLSLFAEHPELEPVPALKSRWKEFDHLQELAGLLGRIGDPQAREVLHFHLDGLRGDESLLAALSGLWHCAEAEDGAALLEVLLDSKAPTVRRKACLVLGRVGHGPAVRPLIDLLQQGNRGLARDAHWALKRITGLRLRAEPELWESWWARGGARRFPG